MQRAPLPACLLTALFLPARLPAQVCDPSIPCDRFAPGDFDEDGDVDGHDHMLFVACAVGPAAPVAAGCEYVDLDGDGDGDQSDFGLWQTLISGECHCPPMIKEPPTSQFEGPMRSVHLFSGEFEETAVDLHIKGRGIDFVWARQYRSRIGPDTEMGHGWDYAAKKRIERAGPHLRVHDGNSRAAVYYDRGDGTWARHEMTHVLQQSGLLTYRLVFPDRSVWNFLPLDGSPAEGKIDSIVDRNGNTLSYGYDRLGRLTAIRDSLDSPTNSRVITVGYNSDGLIASVTDFIGRQVRYEYYQAGESGGSPGDLKAVWTPEVIGTPTGNDFPLGKKTVYTYSTGFADERLNHNLLTITDPKGQTYLTNSYSLATNPNDPTFDWLTRQALGDHPQEVLDLVAAATTPGPDNNNAVIEVIVNDGMGNVSHWAYDKSHRLVRSRRYTGRADPTIRTTPSSNRPQNPLRPTDPPYFEARYEYNDDSFVTRILHPNGNEEQFQYDEDNLDPRSRGNLLQHCTLPGPLGGDQPQICEAYEYDPAINHDSNFPTRHVDGRGHDALFEYDANGNLTLVTGRIPTIQHEYEHNAFGQMTAHLHPDNGSGHRRRDEYTYYDSGAAQGYLHEVIVDVGPRGAAFNNTTTYGYDAVGNIVQVTDPRGNDRLITYNDLNQVVRMASRPINLVAGTVRYETTYYYDGNDNLVRVCRQNVDDEGNLDPSNGYMSRLMEYDGLDNLIRTCEESGSFNVPTSPPQLDCTGLPPSEFITTEYGYDNNNNLVFIRFGEAVEGRQPANTVVRVYDERDLLFQETRAPGDPHQSTRQHDYDGNGNMTITYTGLEAPIPHFWPYRYDGYNRLVSTADPMGNVTGYTYDANGNLTEYFMKGELLDTSPGSSGNARLAQVRHVFDDMDRPIIVGRVYFDPATQIPITDGTSNTLLVWNNTSQLLSYTDDNARTTTFTYDTANRKHVVTDPKGNSTAYTYDSNSNVIAVTELEKSDLGNPDETFTTLYNYDALDRIIRSTDNVGNLDQQAYDSRDNLTSTIDARGNRVRYRYDGLNRLIATEHDLTTTGDGAGTVTGVIQTMQSWDDSNRLVTETDGNGNTTTHVYDALGRAITTEFADCTSRQRLYDVHDNPIQTTEASGTVADHSYDLLNRMTHATYTPGPTVPDDTTFDTFTYDGLSRVRSALNDDAAVTFEYDSLGNVLRQIQNGYVTTSSYDGVGNKLTCTYPGGRVVAYVYDELNRISRTEDGAGHVHGTYDFIGPDRMERMDYENNTAVEYTYDGEGNPLYPNPTGDFGVRQRIGSKHFVRGGPVIDERTYKWDPVYNKIQRVEVTPSQFKTTQDFDYDSVYRLADSTTQISFPQQPLTYHVDYIHDDVNNRIEVLDNGPPQIYIRDATLCEPADDQMNQYTDSSFARYSHDSNGNVQGINDATQFVSANRFDVHDRLVQHTRADGSVIRFDYDAFGRRTAKTVQSGGNTSSTQYLWGDDRRAHCNFWQVLEERDATGTLLRHFTYGGGLDDVVHMGSSGHNYFYHHDDMGNVVALTDPAGNVVERNAYSDYGGVSVEDASGNPRPGSQVGNPYFYTGRRLDPETGLYYFRQRYLDPATGRFTSRDPLGIWGAPTNLGNPYTYVGNNPWTHLDPTGTARSSKPKEIVVVGSKVKEVVKEAGLRSDGELVQALADATSGRHSPVFTDYRPQFYLAPAIPTGASASGLPTGKRRHHPFTVIKPVDNAHGHLDFLKQVGDPATSTRMNIRPLHDRVPVEPVEADGTFLVMERSFSPQMVPMPQTREHVLLARQVGVPAGNSSSRDKRKQSLYFPEAMLEEIQEEAHKNGAIPVFSAAGGPLTPSTRRSYLYFAKLVDYQPSPRSRSGAE